MKKNTVTVGICAYNEEGNIQNILKDILNQKTSNYILKEIIIHCDNCTDRTVEKIKDLKNKKIKIIESKTRQGKSGGLKKIIEKCSGDILVVFDADEKLGNIKVISNIIKKFRDDKKITFVGANTRPFLPVTFFEKVVYTTFLVFDESRKLRNYKNPFCFTGGGMAIRRRYIKSIDFSEKALNEDDFIYFTATKDKKEFSYCEEAKIFYKLPKSLPDYLKQCFRSNPQAININYKTRFGKIVEEEYKRPFMFYLKSIFKSFLKYPIETSVAIVINIVIVPFYKNISSRYKLEWYTASSTK